MNESTTQASVVQEVRSALLHVRDLPATVAWYADLLGLERPKLDPERPFHEFVMKHGANLLLDDHRHDPLPVRPVCMLATADARAAHAWCGAHGVTTLGDVVDAHPGLAWLDIEDSEGNALRLVQSDWIAPQPPEPARPDHPVEQRLVTVIIPVRDLKRATEWYSRLLGQPIKPDRVDGGPIYWFDLPNGTGILLDDNRNNADFRTWPTFMLKASNIHDAIRFARESGVHIVREVQFDHWFAVEDPEGHTVMICLG